MRQAGLPCEILPCDADETVPDGTPPEAVVLLVSGRKAERAAELISESADFLLSRDGNEPPGVSDTPDIPVLIIAADTIVYLDGQILGKPSGPAEASDMINRLQGRTHTVYTGVTLIQIRSGARESSSFFVTADVRMRPLSRGEIDAYVATGEPLDKAGAYGIQEYGAALVERVEGDYFAVVGLPLSRLAVELKRYGVNIQDYWKKPD
jgi:septum formation protein